MSDREGETYFEMLQRFRKDERIPEEIRNTLGGYVMGVMQYIHNMMDDGNFEKHRYGIAKEKDITDTFDAGYKDINAFYDAIVESTAEYFAEKSGKYMAEYKELINFKGANVRPDEGNTENPSI